MANYIRIRQGGGCYFFTLVTYRRRPFLTEDIARHYLREAIIKTRRRYPFEIKAWVLLPDHLHCIWFLPEDDDYPLRWRLIKSRFAKHAKAHYHQIEHLTETKSKRRELTIWQRRFWEHRIRDEQDYLKHLEYIHYNPVKHGWVEQAQDWPFSTYHDYLWDGFSSPF